MRVHEDRALFLLDASGVTLGCTDAQSVRQFYEKPATPFSSLGMDAQSAVVVYSQANRTRTPYGN
jgi:hypothetical protein